MIKELIKISNKLDLIGLTKEADELDGIIRKMASSPIADEDAFVSPADAMGFKSMNDVKSYINNINAMIGAGGIYDPEKVGHSNVTRMAYRYLATTLQNALNGNHSPDLSSAIAMWNETSKDTKNSKITDEEFNKVLTFYTSLSKRRADQPIFNF